MSDEVPSAEPQPAEGSDQGGALPGVQKRISQLVGRAKVAEQKNDQYEQKIASYEQRLAEFERRLQEASRPAPSAPSHHDPIFGPSQQPPSRSAQAPAAGGDDFRALIRDAVNEAITPLRQEQETSRLRAAQQASFEEAAELMPELGVPGSEQSRLFNQIWESNPELQRMSNGPAFVINAIAGVLGSGRAVPVAHRKQAMSSPAPQAGYQRLQAGAPDAKKAEEVLKQAVQGQNREYSTREQADLVTLSLAKELAKLNR